MALPTLTDEHRQMATRLMRGGDACLYEYECGLLNDLRAHGFRWIAPCGIAYIYNEDLPASAEVYQRLFGSTSYAGTEAGYRRWIRGLNPFQSRMTAWLGRVGESLE